MTILVVEDEKNIASFLKKGLEFEKYTVETAYDGREGLAKGAANTYDVIVLDILLPEMNGFDLCQKLRSGGVATPIIMLTCLGTVEDRIQGLDAGADDYLVKPFDLPELLARIRALLRREKQVKPVILRVGDLTLDPATHEVRKGGQLIPISGKEYRILDYMMRRPGLVCTRIMIGEHVWGYDFITRHSKVIDTFVSLLRKKIDRDPKNRLIHTVHDAGYKIQAKTESAVRAA
jgi:DNA-binding response OmpR family regulator